MGAKGTLWNDAPIQGLIVAARTSALCDGVVVVLSGTTRPVVGVRCAVGGPPHAKQDRPCAVRKQVATVGWEAVGQGAGVKSEGVRIGVDIGGTFTDLQILDARDGSVRAWKTPTTPEDPSHRPDARRDEAAERFGFALADVGLLLHGTTIATNAVLERKLAARRAADDGGLRGRAGDQPPRAARTLRLDPDP